MTLFEKKLEQVSTEYGDNRVKDVLRLGDAKPTREDKLLQKYDTYDLENAFEQGAEWALSQQWISVEDALPEMYERVLAFRVFPKRSVFISKRIPHDITDPASDRWHWSNMVNDSEIRYWMPLPQMPKVIE